MIPKFLFSFPCRVSELGVLRFCLSSILLFVCFFLSPSLCMSLPFVCMFVRLFFCRMDGIWEYGELVGIRVLSFFCF